VAPSRPKAGQPGPEHAVRGPKLGPPPGALAFEDEELMAKGQDLCVKRSAPPEERSDRGEEGGEGRGHRRGSLTGSAENINEFGPDEILGRDSQGGHGRSEASDCQWGAPGSMFGWGVSVGKSGS